MRIMPLCLIMVLSLLVTEDIGAVNTESRDLPLDGLSAAAFACIMLGIASLFIIPGLSLLFIPAGFIMGMFALFGKKKTRFDRRRGRGLAIAAVILGGAYVGLFVVAFIVTSLFGFF